MAGCGYVCPKCEGKGLLDDGSVCDWCTLEEIKKSSINKLTTLIISMFLLHF